MGQQLRARLGPAGRVELAQLQLDEGAKERAAATALSVAPGTARRWKLRRLTATEAELASGAWALGRSSRPHRSPKQTDVAIERQVCEARQRCQGRSKSGPPSPVEKWSTPGGGGQLGGR